MSEECKFYFYDHDYCCALRKQTDNTYVVDSDWVHRYCWGYNYERCPYYQNRNDSHSSGCFLSTACVISMGGSNNCFELEVLRHFRDKYLLITPEGKKEVKHYYVVAPQIVDGINNDCASLKKWKQIYNCLILPCVHMIQSGEIEQAHVLYKRAICQLEIKYINKERKRK